MSGSPAKYGLFAIAHHHHPQHAPVPIAYLLASGLSCAVGFEKTLVGEATTLRERLLGKEKKPYEHEAFGTRS